MSGGAGSKTAVKPAPPPRQMIGCTPSSIKLSRLAFVERHGLINEKERWLIQMRHMVSVRPTILASALIGTSIAASVAHAQFTTYVQPNPFGGGYTVQTPGASPYTTYVQPNPFSGGYTVQTPGASPYTTYVQPNPFGGGYTVQTPGAPFNQRY
jgi:hypothetical protein